MSIFLKQAAGLILYLPLYFIVSLFYTPSADAYVLSDKIVAVINDQVITESELRHKLHWMETQIASKKMPHVKNLREQTLQHMINLEVQNQAAEKAGITVTDALLEHVMQETLEKRKQTLEELQNELNTQGISYDDYRTQLRQEIAYELLQHQMEVSRISLSNQEIRNQALGLASQAIYYRIEDFLIPSTSKSARKKAMKALKEAQQGRSFRELRTSYQGQFNDLGLRTLAALPTAFSESVATLKPGQIAGPILAPNGFHLILLKEIVHGKPSVFEEDSATTKRMQHAAQLAYQRKLLEAQIQWLHGLRAKAHIRIL